MVGLLVAALLWGGTVPVAVAAPEPSWASADELDAFLRERVEELRLPGLAVVVVTDGEVHFEGTYGEARPGVAVTLDTPFLLGSRSGERPTPSPMAPYAAPAALLTSTARDLTTLVRAHLGTGTGVDPEVLRAAREPLGAVDEHTDYASGWLVRGLWELTDDDVGWDSPDRPTLWEHEGSIPRALSSLSFSPELGLGVVALTNTGAGTDQVGWWRFRYDLHHAVLGTRGLPQEPDLLVAAAPLLMPGLPMAQAGTLIWWAVTRHRRPLGSIARAAAGATAALALVFAFGLVSPRTGMPLLDHRWVAVVPDLAISVAAMLALASAFVVAAVTAAVRGRRRSPGQVRRGQP